MNSFTFTVLVIHEVFDSQVLKGQNHWQFHHPPLFMFPSTPFTSQPWSFLLPSSLHSILNLTFLTSPYLFFWSPDSRGLLLSLLSLVSLKVEQDIVTSPCCWWLKEKKTCLDRHKETFAHFRWNKRCMCRQPDLSILKKAKPFAGSEVQWGFESSETSCFFFWTPFILLLLPSVLFQLVFEMWTVMSLLLWPQLAQSDCILSVLHMAVN